MDDVNVTELPAQKVVGPPSVIEGIGGFAMTLTITGAEDGEEQPFESI